MKPRVLFLCTGNSCRSQMAEGFARALPGAPFVAASAGIEKHGLNPRAVAVMAEVGIDIAGHVSRTLDELGNLEFDLVVTVCSRAHESCPVFPGRAVVLHRGFDDPPKVAAGLTDEAEILDVYRRVRDEIDASVRSIPEILRGL